LIILFDDDLVTTRKVNNMEEDVDDTIVYNLMEIRKRMNEVLIQILVKVCMSILPKTPMNQVAFNDGCHPCRYGLVYSSNDEIEFRKGIHSVKVG
jgi:hypothetical protein